MSRPKYKVTWFFMDAARDQNPIKVRAHTLQEAMDLIPFGPIGWQRYLLTYGKLFIQRGDPQGSRSGPARFDDLSQSAEDL